MGGEGIPWMEGLEENFEQRITALVSEDQN